MADYQQNDNSGALFRNDRREREDQPSYKGSATIAGVDYWVSAWVNTSKAGKKYFGMKYEAKEEQNYSANNQKDFGAAAASDDFEQF